MKLDKLYIRLIVDHCTQEDRSCLIRLLGENFYWFMYNDGTATVFGCNRVDFVDSPVATAINLMFGARVKWEHNVPYPT
jgi:hypothetical protein